MYFAKTGKSNPIATMTAGKISRTFTIYVIPNIFAHIDLIRISKNRILFNSADLPFWWKQKCNPICVAIMNIIMAYWHPRMLDSHNPISILPLYHKLTARLNYGTFLLVIQLNFTQRIRRKAVLKHQCAAACTKLPENPGCLMPKKSFGIQPVEYQMTGLLKSAHIAANRRIYPDRNGFEVRRSCLVRFPGYKPCS